MFKHIIRVTISIFVISFLFTACATVFNGYEDKVELIMANDSLKIYTMEGKEVKIETEQKRFIFFDQKNNERAADTLTTYFINLRSSDSHTLVLKKGNKKKIIEIYPKIGGGWLIFDILTGMLPAIIDMYTGNWNFFENINVEF